jgi:Cysteine-rich secretory protein family
MRNHHRFLGAGVLALALGALTALAGGILPAHADSVTDEGAFVARINGLRNSQGLGSLTVDPRLVGVARAWSAHMAATAVLAHNPSLPAQSPPGWSVVGENVGEGPTVDVLQAAFMASPHHYTNMVDPRYTSIGVGIVETNGVIWVTEDYMASGFPALRPPPPPPPLRPPPPHTVSRSAPPRPPAPPALAPPVTAAPAVAAPAPPADPSLEVTVVLEQLQSLDPGTWPQAHAGIIRPV